MLSYANIPCLNVKWLLVHLAHVDFHRHHCPSWWPTASVYAYAGWFLPAIILYHQQCHFRDDLYLQIWNQWFSTYVQRAYISIFSHVHKAHFPYVCSKRLYRSYHQIVARRQCVPIGCSTISANVYCILFTCYWILVSVIINHCVCLVHVPQCIIYIGEMSATQSHSRAEYSASHRLQCTQSLFTVGLPAAAALANCTYVEHF